MRRLSFPHDEAVVRLTAQLADFVSAAAAFGDLELLAPSRCHGWSRLDLVVHVRIGLEEMALGSVNRVDAAADRDAASYWSGSREDADPDPVPGILWLRRVAGAHTRPTRAVSQLVAAAGVVTTAISAMTEGVVEFQGGRLLSGDFLATWVVELAIHQLDLDGPGSPSGLDWARRTVEALAGADLPVDLDDCEAVLLGLGRVDPAPPFVLPASFPVPL